MYLWSCKFIECTKLYFSETTFGCSKPACQTIVSAVSGWTVLRDELVLSHLCITFS